MPVAGRGGCAGRGGRGSRAGRGSRWGGFAGRGSRVAGPRRTTTRRSRTTRRPILSISTTTELNETPRRQNNGGFSNRVVQSNNVTVNTLYKCDFSNPDSCEVKTAGKQWSFAKGYYAVGLNSLEKTELYFNNIIPPPKSKDKGVACLTFRYKKYFPGI